MKEFSARLQQARERAGLSKKELAERSGVTRQTITNWEGSRLPAKGIPYLELNRLVRALGNVSSIELLRLAGYDVACPNLDGEEDFFDAYMKQPPEKRAVLRSWLQLDRPQTMGQEHLTSHLRAADRPESSE